jgi:hypothetical protein
MFYDAQDADVERDEIELLAEMFAIALVFCFLFCCSA